MEQASGRELQRQRSLRLPRNMEKRYYCSPAKCRWMAPQEKEQFFSSWDDVTDLSDDEFLDYVIKGIKNDTKPTS
jgi:hypothetical protein